VGMRVRRTFLNGIRSQGGFYLVNEICLRGRCDAFAHGRDLRDADNVRAAGLRSARQGIVRGVAEEEAEFAGGHEGASHFS